MGGKLCCCGKETEAKDDHDGEEARRAKGDKDKRQNESRVVVGIVKRRKELTVTEPAKQAQSVRFKRRPTVHPIRKSVIEPMD